MPASALLGVLIVVGIVTMATELAVSGLFVSSFRDYIPKGKEGCFQGIRMFLFVLLPMIIGPAIGGAIIDEYGWYTVSEITGEEILNYPYEMFLGAAIVAVFTLLPAIIVMKKEPAIRARLLAERDAADGAEPVADAARTEFAESASPFGPSDENGEAACEMRSDGGGNETPDGSDE